MHYTTTHGCTDGWLGHDDEHKPIPCLICRPNLVKTAQINDCGNNDQPIRRHPVEDMWPEVVEAEFTEGYPGTNLREISTPTALDGGKLVVQADSPSWATSLRSRTESLIHRVNLKAGDNVVTSIVVTVPPGPHLR
ncbi:DciA family protein [Nocardia colli]|uniref:DciA family protein n=1 Tax=Nocardia colli TaxID=2545717 RepID=UPI0035DD802F